jgi:hypothetical protein
MINYLYIELFSAIFMVNVAVYIDESGSMTHSLTINRRNLMKIDIANEIWKRAIVPSIVNENCRVRSIDSKNKSREILPLNTYSQIQLESIQLRTSGWTYMWEFLVEEAKNFNQNEDWLIVLISDGIDNESAPPYDGIDGLEACIEDIRNLGHKPDFHIIGLDLSSQDAQAKLRLSGATGGLFFNITSSTDFDYAINQIKAGLEENIHPHTREAGIRRKQNDYEISEDFNPEVGPTVTYRNEEDVEEAPIDIDLVVTRFGRGLDELNSTNNLHLWHKIVLQSLFGHRIVPNQHQIIDSWTRPNKRKKYWKSIAFDYAELSKLHPSSLLKILNQLKEYNPKSFKIFIRTGPGPKNQDVENFLSLLSQLGFDVIRLPSSIPPRPYPTPWDENDGGGDYWNPDPDGPSDWNHIPSNNYADCRPFLMVEPVVNKKMMENKRGVMMEHCSHWVADFPHIYHRDNEFLENLGEECRFMMEEIDFSDFGLILIDTLRVLNDCYVHKSITKQLWFNIPQKVINCGILDTSQWREFWSHLVRVIAQGPYPLPVYINGELQQI